MSTEPISDETLSQWAHYANPNTDGGRVCDLISELRRTRTQLQERTHGNAMKRGMLKSRGEKW